MWGFVLPILGSVKTYCEGHGAAAGNQPVVDGGVARAGLCRAVRRADGAGGGHSIVASIPSGGGEKAIGLRADFDALPWKSQIPGRVHLYGHDGHRVMLPGAAHYLPETRNSNGTVTVNNATPKSSKRGRQDAMTGPRSARLRA
ncbi:hypothetical protein [Rhodobacter maris]